jgi:hypothetical protein
MYGVRPAEREAGAPAERRREEAKAHMNGDPPDTGAEARARGRELPPAAQRALAEAEARRAQPRDRTAYELNGRGGLDPARYGDWEVKGLASDF